MMLLTFGACGSSDDKDSGRTGALGSSCDPDQLESCNADLACSAHDDGFVCTLTAGAPCDPHDTDLDNGGCADTEQCKAPQTEANESTNADAEADQDPRCFTLRTGACDPDHPFCDAGLTCAEVTGGEHRCFEPVVFRGDVSDSSNGDPVAEAQVIAINAEGVAVSDVAITDADGSYELPVPVARDEDGAPVDATFTLRASADLYQPFPSGIRVALPISSKDATLDAPSYVVDSALTDITLIPLDAEGLHSITGQVMALDGSHSEVGGVLVVASGDGGAISAISDKSGNFTIFNVPEGSYTVSGYAADIQLESDSVTVDADDVDDVELLERSLGTTRVSGNIQIVNAPGNAQTSVILVVEDTFDPDAASGEVPRGLRAPKSGAPNVDGDFVIEGVPEGRYVVLAAYENDDLVRDPDTNIGGTGFVSVEISADQPEVSLSESFKVTEALEIFSPGVDAPESVSTRPTLTWADDSSEDWYEVRVFNAFGDEVWQNLMVPSVSGKSEVTLDYEGPLDPGMYYQFRVLSWRQPGNGDAAPISASEDLRGVFFMPVE